MERIEQKRQETRQMLEISKKSKLQAMESVSYLPVRSLMEPTVTKPFHFSESHHRHNGGAAAAPKYKPMAQAINLFHSKTPDRFRTKATKDANKGGWYLNLFFNFFFIFSSFSKLAPCVQMYKAGVWFFQISGFCAFSSGFSQITFFNKKQNQKIKHFPLSFLRGFWTFGQC